MVISAQSVDSLLNGIRGRAASTLSSYMPSSDSNTEAEKKMEITDGKSPYIVDDEFNFTIVFFQVCLCHTVGFDEHKVYNT